MKNMSFGKMMAIFGGFLVLLIVCAVVIIKMTAKGPATSQVTTKKYIPQARAGQERPTGQALDRTVPGAPADTPATANAGAVADAPAPAAIAPGVAPANQMLGLASARTGAAPVVLADVKPHLNSLDTSVNDLNVRVAVLENRQSTASAAAAAGAVTPRREPTRRSPTRSKTVELAAKPAPAPAAVSAVQLSGYKSMAVVGNRAWISAPDGHEESVVAGDPVPRPRVRALDKETGIVVTSADERIDAR